MKTKFCKSCQQNKKTCEYSIVLSSKDGYKDICKKCYATKWRNLRKMNPDKYYKYKPLYKQGKRKCCHCKIIYELNGNNFYPSKKKYDVGFRYSCISCTKKLVKLNKPLKRFKFKNRFKEEHNFTCQICGLNKPNNYAFFDIDHIKPIRRKRHIGIRQVTRKESNNLQLLCPNCHREKTIKDSECWKHLAGKPKLS